MPRKKMSHEEIIEKMKNDAVEEYYKSLSDLEEEHQHTIKSIETIDDLYGERVKGN